jgi:hypothetical protein
MSKAGVASTRQTLEEQYMITQKRLEDVASKLDDKQEPHGVICDAIWLVFGDNAELSEHYDDCWVENGNTRLYYLLTDDEMTIMACERQHPEFGSHIIVGRLDETISDINQAYASKHGGQICKRCAEMCSVECVECPDCGHYVDGTDCPELVLPDSIAECLEDGGSDRYVWVLKERLPTHTTPSNHTYVFIQLDVVGQDGKYRGTFDRPDLWFASIRTVNVGMAGKSGAKQVMQCFGWDEDTWKALPHVGKAQALLEYGLAATLWDNSGTSPRRLLDAALSHLPEVAMFCGFKLDAPQNAIGTSGWDFMRGDILAGLKRD